MEHMSCTQGRKRMLIKTQDKTCVCNLDKMAGISIAEKSDGECYLTMRFSSAHADNCALGTYKSKDRAIEVLEEICNAYEELNYVDRDTARGIVMNGIYQMPEV